MIDPGHRALPRPLPAPLAPGEDLRWFVGLENTCVYPRPSDDFDPLDEYELTGHNVNWRHDIDRISRLGLDGLRYGMSWPSVHVAPGRFDWRRLDPVLEHMDRLDLHVIADLVHYGCPPWLEGSFADAAFVPALTEFALALVERFGPALGSLTPVNEPLTTASFCGLRKIWPPALGSRRGWATVTVALAEATQSVIHHVRAAAPDMPIVHVEASHLYETAEPVLDSQVAELVMLNDLPTDLIVGRCVPGSPSEAWLTGHGVDPERLARLVERAETPDMLGVNYYPDLSPRVLASVGGTVGQLTADRWATGLASAVRHAADRYGLPVLVTETSTEGTEARRSAWLKAAAAELRQLRRDGLDVRGLTWWPLIDFVDWSYIAGGASVEEFMVGVIDPASRELVAEPTRGRDRDGGVAAFARRMGLFTLADDGLRRTATTTAAELATLTARGEVPAEPPRCWHAAAASVHPEVVALDHHWTLTDSGGREVAVDVPGVWEAQGLVDLDGTVRYRRHFTVEDPGGHWTLRFGAVMDRARVELNGVEVGRHDLPYTPFEIDVSGLLCTRNTLVVEVTDPPSGSVEHLTSAHGKQGWANHEFPSPPSLYVTYGGIVQPVTLRRHGQVAIRDLYCNLDPRDTVVEVEIQRLSTATGVCDETGAEVNVTVELGGLVRSASKRIAPGERRRVVLSFGDTGLDRWSPRRPILHRCRAAVLDATHGSCSMELDASELEVGLRTVELADGRLSINGTPVFLRSALVQGFHHEHIYTEGTEADIEREIKSAQRLGFNMLRLHLRPFDPRYLAACDRLGMLVHCDTSIAEPLRHDELDDLGPLARHCAAAVTAQARRDRSHPAVVLWSCMNEIGVERPSLRRTDRYERFVSRIVGALRAQDDTRPFIENDWIDPDTDRVFTAPLATAHWYGHLDRNYLAELRSRCQQLHTESLPVAITEFGDWGLPDPASGEGRFYDHAATYEKMLADTFWPGSLAEFSTATQTYQGVADRLQIDTIRASGSTAGYCLTELTDVPWEFNGVLDIERNAKTHAASHLTAANRRVSPILALQDFGATTARPVVADAWIVNDSDADLHLEIHAVHESSIAGLGTHVVGAHSVVDLGQIRIEPTAQPGAAEVVLEARDLATGRLHRSAYPVVVHSDGPAAPVAVNAADPAASRLVASTPWLATRPSRLMLVGEDRLEQAGDRLLSHLASGAVAVVMAQRRSAGTFYTGVADTQQIRCEWGGTPFRYSTDAPIIGSFPQRTVLHVHDADIAPDTVLVPTVPVVHAAVGVFKPPPRPAAGLVLGALDVAGGTIIACQYRLQAALESGSATAWAVFADIVSWANDLSHIAENQQAASGTEATDGPVQ